MVWIIKKNCPFVKTLLNDRTYLFMRLCNMSYINPPILTKLSVFTNTCHLPIFNAQIKWQSHIQFSFRGMIIGGLIYVKWSILLLQYLKMF